MTAACLGMPVDRFVFEITRHNPTSKRIAAAQAICTTCDPQQRALCLTSELDLMRGGIVSYGIRAGTTPRQRAAMLARPWTGVWSVIGPLRMLALAESHRLRETMQ